MHRIDPMNREQATVVLVDFWHTKLGFQEEGTNILSTSLEKSKTTYAAKKSN